MAIVIDCGACAWDTQRFASPYVEFGFFETALRNVSRGGGKMSSCIAWKKRPLAELSFFFFPQRFASFLC